MSTIPWEREINFTSALLLHSCLTVISKEIINALTCIRRLILRQSVVVDAYTSIFSHDIDGLQAELYFTNTGILLLAVSLAASVAMNLILQDLVLNMVVAGTFCLCFIASILVGHNDLTLPIMALRRAGRFIWSDTPFVNFFTLIYIATVLRGISSLRLQDYVTFRSIAVLELVFMKAKLAASKPEEQEELMRSLVDSEWKIVSAVSRIDDRANRQGTDTGAKTKSQHSSTGELPYVSRHNIVAFQTQQRLSVMLLKTSIGYENGCLQGLQGPCRCYLPAPGKSFMDMPNSLKICRPNEDLIILIDCFEKTSPSDMWMKFLTYAHGVLLRMIGKVRVVYVVRSQHRDPQNHVQGFHSNVNLVTGVSKTWLENFPEGGAVGSCIISG